MNISETIAVVTGAASGLGLGAAEMLVARGAKVVLVDIDPRSVEAAAQRLAGTGYACDVSSDSAVEALFRDVADRLGTPRILVNCAGVLGSMRTVSRRGPASLDAFRRVIEVNLAGSFNMIRCFAHGVAGLERDGDGSLGVIVNTASVAADEGLSGQSAYAASKGGIVAMNLPLARELAKFAIRVASISPGVFQTGMIGDIPEETREVLITDVVFPRRMGLPEEFARLACEIVENEMINGANYRLDAGIRMRDPKVV